MAVVDRIEYERLLQQARRMISVLRAVVDAPTPEEKDRAWVTLNAELDQQMAADRDAPLGRPRASSEVGGNGHVDGGEDE